MKVTTIKYLFNLVLKHTWRRISAVGVRCGVVNVIEIRQRKYLELQSYFQGNAIQRMKIINALILCILPAAQKNCCIPFIDSIFLALKDVLGTNVYIL